MSNVNHTKMSNHGGNAGVMNALKSQKVTLEEHLDRPKLRNRIANRIDEYYEKKRIDVDAAVIEKSVDEWFANRLRYQQPELSKNQHYAVQMYLTSRTWLKGLGLALLIVALLVGYKIYADKRELIKLHQDLAHELATTQQMNSRVAQMAQQISVYKSQSLHYASQAAKEDERKIEPLLAKYKVNIKTPLPVDPLASRDQLKQRLTAEQTYNRGQAALFDPARKLNHHLSRLVKADRTLSKLLVDPRYPRYIKQTPHLAAMMSSAESALSKNTANEDRAFTKVEKAISQESTRDNLYAELDQRRTKFAALQLSDADRAAVDVQITAARNLIYSADLTESSMPLHWKAALEDLDYTYALITTPLVLSVEQTPGEESIVQKTSDTTGETNWYVIAEAHTEQGEPFPMNIVETDSGEHNQVTSFGVQITREQYEALQRDKQDNGRIDDNIIGLKPAGQMDFKDLKSALQGRILYW